MMPLKSLNICVKYPCQNRCKVYLLNADCDQHMWFFSLYCMYLPTRATLPFGWVYFQCLNKVLCLKSLYCMFLCYERVYDCCWCINIWSFILQLTNLLACFYFVHLRFLCYCFLKHIATSVLIHHQKLQLH